MDTYAPMRVGRIARCHQVAIGFVERRSWLHRTEWLEWVGLDTLGFIFDVRRMWSGALAQQKQHSCRSEYEEDCVRPRIVCAVSTTSGVVGGRDVGRSEAHCDVAYLDNCPIERAGARVSLGPEVHDRSNG